MKTGSFFFINKCLESYDYIGDIMLYYDDKVLVVGNFKKILELSNKEISFSFKRYDLIVKGDYLMMPYLEDNEVGIKGLIKSIEFKYKMVKEDV